MYVCQYASIRATDQDRASRQRTDSHFRKGGRVKHDNSIQYRDCNKDPRTGGGGASTPRLADWTLFVVTWSRVVTLLT